MVLQCVELDLASQSLPKCSLSLGIHPEATRKNWQSILANVARSLLPGGVCVFATYFDIEAGQVQRIAASAGLALQLFENPYYKGKAIQSGAPSLRFLLVGRCLAAAGCGTARVTEGRNPQETRFDLRGKGDYNQMRERQGPPWTAKVVAEGRVKTFNSKHGFGFIDCPAANDKFGRDVFIHKAQLGDVPVGADITFEVRTNKDGHPQAKDVQNMDGSKPGPYPEDGEETGHQDMNGEGGGGKGKSKKGGDKGKGGGGKGGGGKKGGGGGFGKGGGKDGGKGGGKGGKGGGGGKGKKGGGKGKGK
ncbi:unnamed protein product [Symbiodinium natans]|uniref:CSD domain-containing protein n=1 Tax=Symbiodinium natans TaxID=878477 RepID=A0A812IK54_9DINO|nr:unnamed protein product [Symbiodinium natans]